MTIIALIIVLGVIIFVHELGHFWAAKAVGIHVERFSIGLGPRVWGFTRGGTEYVLSAIPLGGYVKMKGMGDEAIERVEGNGSGDADEDATPEETGWNAGGEPKDDESYLEGPSEPAPPEERPEWAAAAEPSPDSDSFNAKSIPARAFVISAGVAMNMVFAFVAYAVVAGGWGQTVPDTTQLGYVHAEVLPEEAETLGEIPRGAHLTRIGDAEVEHWLDVQRALRDAPAGPLEVHFAEPDGSVEVTLPEDPGVRNQAISALHFWQEPVIQVVLPGEPAEAGGLEDGDRIVGLDGEDVDLWHEVTHYIQDRPGQEIRVRVERDGRELVRTVTPRGTEGTDLAGDVREIGRIGIYVSEPPTRFESVPASRAVVVGAEQTVAVTGMILGFLGDLVTGELSVRTLGGVGTIGEAAGQAAEQGFDRYLNFLALFSINIAILNLLPIPILDGGHLVFLGFEAVRGRPLSIETQMRWNYLGLFIILGILVLAHVNDVVRLLL